MKARGEGQAIYARCLAAAYTG